MRQQRAWAVIGAIALGVSGTVGAMSASAAPTIGGPTAGSATTTKMTTSGQIVVLTKKGSSVDAVVSRVKKAGGTIASVNRDIGMVVVSTKDDDFPAKARRLAGVDSAAAEVSIGRSPMRSDAAKPNEDLLKEHQASPSKSRAALGRGGSPKARSAGDPLDEKLWAHDILDVDRARKVTSGDRRVKVGIIDTGVQASHPDIAANFDRKLSKNFTYDIPMIDGDCEYDGCVDPASVDHDGHGTHVAGTIAAAANGYGVSGIAPGVSIVNIRGGQDSGFFFLTPVVNALTYAADQKLDVVNMSFYVDPWAFNCVGGAPQDNPEQAAQQDVTIESMERVLDYAHRKDVTLVAALGNEHDDLAKPRNDVSSPDFPDGVAHERTIDNASCYDLPVEGPHVIGTSSVGPSKRKADYSNFTTDLRGKEIEVAAPGGWYRDGFGTDSYRSNENLILSTAPLRALQEQGFVSRYGYITAAGKSAGVMKECTNTRIARGASRCGYFQYLQGTSMAAPHAAGVAALIVSKQGRVRGGDFGMDSRSVAQVLMRSAVDNPCPESGTQDYIAEGRSSEFTATCVSKPGFNGFYGDGIVNAHRAVNHPRR